MALLNLADGSGLEFFGDARNDLRAESTRLRPRLKKLKERRGPLPKQPAERNSPRPAQERPARHAQVGLRVSCHPMPSTFKGLKAAEGAFRFRLSILI